MAWRIYCLQCHAILGEAVEDGESDRDPQLGICQTCGQHGGVEPARAATVPRGVAGPAAGHDRAGDDRETGDAAADNPPGTDAAGPVAWCRWDLAPWRLAASAVAGIVTAVAGSVRLLPAGPSRPTA